MQTVVQGLLAGHIAFGLISILCFWVPMWAKKGGKLHRQSGKVYVICMWVVVITAALLCCIRLLQGHYIMAGFLGYLSILTAVPLWFGISILNYKKEIPKPFLQINRVLNLILFLGGVGLIIWSITLKVQNEAVLLLIFGIVGLTTITDVLRPIAKAQAETSWIMEHIEGMIGTAIAAYTAFFAFGGRSLFSHFLTDYWMIVPWVLPTILGTIAAGRMKKRWAKTKSGARTSDVS